ncbi:MAG: transglutaminase domain-containing protein [Oscillospiraceae bacterium]|nr:transglutaminase domain-containing protein [Oscillospiraceae bacterium]
MKKGAIACILALCLLLSGCTSFLDGSYVYVQLHEHQSAPSSDQTLSAHSYSQLYAALKDMAQTGVENGVIYVREYRQSEVIADAQRALQKLVTTDPIAAYAVETMTFDLGTSGGEPALAVSITYVHDKSEIRQIKKAKDLDAATTMITSALNAFEVGIVIHISEFTATDFVQIVESHAVEYPEYIIEQPQVTVNLYPETGSSRLVELKFTYQTSRDILKEMQQSVRSMFTSARLYVSGASDPQEKYAQLYSFLMERYDYTIETSITPSYSLLLHGVGDARSFAVVYAAMCRRSGLNCHVVSGTREGEPWYWNIVEQEGVYFHIDLLRSSSDGEFRIMADTEMVGYVWDYSAYPTLQQTQAAE